MPIFVVESRSRPSEYDVLTDVEPRGRMLGYFMDRPIHEAVVDEFGRRFVYSGLASRRPDGQFDCAALGPGEFILEPGLIYRIELIETSWLRSLFGMH